MNSNICNIQRIITAPFLLTLIVAVLTLSGCDGESVSGPVVLYTSVPADLIAQIETAFEKAYPAIDLQVYRQGTTQVMERVNEEIAADQISADLIWVADFTVGEELKNQGVLLPYSPPEAEGLLDILKDKDSTYFAGRILNMVVAYNTEAVTTIPVGYKDLLDPRYKGRVGHATPETSGAFLYFMGTLIQDPTYGEDFFRQLAANEPAIQTNTQTTAQIAAGELDIGITIDFTVRKLLSEDPAAPIDYVYPKAGVVMVPSPIAIFKDTSNLEGAKAFERFILSQEGQTLIRDIGGFVPVRLDVIPPERITSITQLTVLPSDKNWIREHREDIVIKFIEIFREGKDSQD